MNPRRRRHNRIARKRRRNEVVWTFSSGYKYRFVSAPGEVPEQLRGYYSSYIVEFDELEPFE